MKKNKSLYEKVKEKILKGKRTGCISFDEVQRLFPDAKWNEEKIKEMVDIFEEMGVDLILEEEEEDIYIEQISRENKSKVQTLEEETKEARTRLKKGMWAQDESG